MSRGEGEGGVSSDLSQSLIYLLNSDKETTCNGRALASCQADRQKPGGSPGLAMPGYSPSMRQSSHSPQSGTDADSAIGADSSTSPELRHEIDFPEEGGEHFECFGENNGTDFER